LVAFVQGKVAVSLTSKRSFAERVAAFGRPAESTILVWNFRDLIHPEMILESPHEVTSFDFNTVDPGVVVGGCANGQIVMWESTEQLDSRALRGQDEEHKDCVVQHKCMSTLEVSHRSPVTHLQWLPGWEITSKGALNIESADEPFCCFFATCAADGKVNFWDHRADSQRTKKRKNDGAISAACYAIACTV
jgi:dynein intermediate chain 3, axonemal